MSAAHRIPFDLFVLFAQAGGGQLTVTLARLCRHIFSKLDERFVISDQYRLCSLLQKSGKKKPGVFGKLVNIAVCHRWELKHIPETVTELRLKRGLIINEDVQLPPRLQSLVFGNVVCQGEIKLPETLKVLTFAGDNCSIEDATFRFPEGLEHLEFMNEMYADNVQVLSSLPQGLKSLSFSSFNEPVGDLKFPERLEFLDLGDDFNQPVSQLHLPPGLLELEFGYSFNQPVDDLKLPQSLQKLKMGKSFNQPLDGIKLPNGIKSITLFDFNQDISNVQFPYYLERLDLGVEFNQSLDQVHFPDTFTELILSTKFDQPINRLPKSLKRLVLNDTFNRPLAELPPLLESLHLGKSFCFCQSLGGLVIPPSLREISLGYNPQMYINLLTGLGFVYGVDGVTTYYVRM